MPYVEITLSDGSVHVTRLVHYVGMPLDVLAGSTARLVGRTAFLRYRRERVN